MDYSRFYNVYANLPKKIRREVVVVVDGEPYSWDAVYPEISGDTEFGKEVYQKMLKMEII